MADLTRSIQHIVEDLVLNSTLPVKDFIFAASVATSNPADTTALANASALNTATATVTGVAVGDVVVGYGVVSGLATNQLIVDAYVSATDTVTVIIGNLVNSTVTTTAVTMNFIIADVT
jgi:hypothetical protein